VNRMQRVVGLVAVGLALFLGACGDGGEEVIASATTEPVDASPTIDDEVAVNILGSWLVDSVTVNGVVSEQPNDDPATVLIESGGISGDAGCNRFFGEWRFTGHADSVEIDRLAVTEMACVGSDDWLEMLDALAASTVLLADGDARILRSADGAMSVRLIPVAEPDPDDGAAVTEPDDSEAGGSGDATAVGQPIDSADYIGLTEAAAGALAEERGRVWRVNMINGESQALTMDFSEDRYNFAVDDGLVTAVSTG